MRPRRMKVKKSSKSIMILMVILIIALVFAGAALVLNQNISPAYLNIMRQNENTLSSAENNGSDHTMTDGLPNVDLNSWELTLVNEDNPLPNDFEQQLTTLSNGMFFDSRAADYLEQMIEAAMAEDGYDLLVCSAYRSVDRQSELFEQQVSQEQNNNGYNYEDAVEAAKMSVAYPGASEHNLGLAADIVTPEYQRLDDGYAQTAQAQWLKENAARFGFILRYPKDKQDITGVVYEPWHFRYVGIEAATYIMDNKLCLEEFLALY